jgi:hypothetical protein
MTVLDIVVMELSMFLTFITIFTHFFTFFPTFSTLFFLRFPRFLSRFSRSLSFQKVSMTVLENVVTELSTWTTIPIKV